MANGAIGVGALNNYIKELIGRDELLSAVAVCGEISNFKNHYQSGHLYFSLKDEGGAVRAVMFKSYASRLKFRPADGMKVTLYGSVSVYPRDGSYQIYVCDMVPDGEGALWVAYNRLKEKLSAEGLFDSARKRPIPKYPEKIGLVTSDSGAAVRDMINVLGRRYPRAELILYPTLVQGEGAPESICRGIEYFNTVEVPDTVIIGRGGGSIEDLWGFNDERVARAIARSTVPIISAVGHETDFTISDFVADMRAPTPSAAAEIAVPDSETLRRQLQNVATRLGGLVSAGLDAAEARIRLLSSARVLKSPEEMFAVRETQLIFAEDRLRGAYKSLVDGKSASFISACAKLEALSPISVLTRGYAAVYREGRVIADAGELAQGEEISLRMHGGRVEASVTGVKTDSEE